MRSIVFILCLTLGLASKAETKVIHAGSLLAVPGEAVASNQTIIVKSGRIVEVVDGYADVADYGEGAEPVDLKDNFVLPGLMDMHVHLQFELGPENDRDRFIWLKVGP